MQKGVRESSDDAPLRSAKTDSTPVRAPRSRGLHIGPTTLQRAVGGRFWLLAVALAAALCAAPSLRGGLILDDYVIGAFVVNHLRHEPDGRAWWNMFDSYGRSDPDGVRQRIAQGSLPWWSPPDQKLAFLRPLATAAHYLDYLLWPEQPWLMHLHNLAWYGLSAVLAALFFRRSLPPIAAGLAALMYAVDEAHVQGASWIAGRNTLMTTAFVLLTWLVWDHARRSRSRIAAVCAGLALACAHGSSEGSFAVWPYLLGYALWLDRASGSYLRRLQSLLPLAAVSVSWSVVSALGGYGVKGGDLYVDPRATPWLFLQAAAERFPELMRAQLALPRPIEASLAEAPRFALIGASYVLIATLVLVALPMLRRSPSARMLALGCIGSALLACAAQVDPRILFIMGLGAHGLVAQLICECLQSWRSRARGQALLTSLGVTLWMLHVPLALWAGPHAADVMPALDRRAQHLALSLFDASKQRERVLLLNTPDMLTTGFAAVYVSVLSGHQRSVHVLGSSDAPVVLSRPERNALVLEPIDGYLRTQRAIVASQPDKRFRDGQVISNAPFRVVIENTSADGRPARVRFELPDVDDPRVRWVSWNAARDRFESARLPEIGGALWLPGAQAPTGPSSLPLSAAFD